MYGSNLDQPWYGNLWITMYNETWKYFKTLIICSECQRSKFKKVLTFLLNFLKNGHIILSPVLVGHVQKPDKFIAAPTLGLPFHLPISLLWLTLNCLLSSAWISDGSTQKRKRWRNRCPGPKAQQIENTNGRRTPGKLLVKYFFILLCLKGLY